MHDENEFANKLKDRQSQVWHQEINNHQEPQAGWRQSFVKRYFNVLSYEQKHLLHN